jgi:translation initiation factor IF-2
MSYDVLVEAFGGEVQCAMVSAKQGTGIDDLLAKIQLQAELMNLRAPTTCRAEGTIIESRVDKGLGTVVTALIQKGTLKIGDFVLAGPSWGKVRRLISDQGKDVKEAGPSTPVQVTQTDNNRYNAGCGLALSARTYLPTVGGGHECGPSSGG